jgi:predicted chitinase
MLAATTMEITPAILSACMPRAPAEACEAYAPAIQAAAVEFGLTDPHRLAAALASGANESGQLTKFEEVSWIGTDWNRARGMFRHCPPQHDYEAWKALGQAEFDRRFFDAVYGPMMGNAGQGYKYRGLGWGQLTGHDNDKQVGEAIGVDLVENPELMRDDPVIGTRAFFAYLKINRITDPAADGTEAGFLESVRRSNPGLDPAEFRTHHLQRWYEVRAGLGIDHDPRAELRAVQRALNQWNRHLEPLKVDGEMGPKTQARIRQYQMAKSLDVTGEADAATLAALGVA